MVWLRNCLEKMFTLTICHFLIPFELTVEMLIISYGISIGYGHPLTLTNKSPVIQKGRKGDVALKPHGLVTVPLVLDNIRKGINHEMKKRGKLSYETFKFATDYDKWR